MGSITLMNEDANQQMGKWAKSPGWQLDMPDRRKYAPIHRLPAVGCGQYRFVRIDGLRALCPFAREALLQICSALCRNPVAALELLAGAAGAGVVTADLASVGFGRG